MVSRAVVLRAAPATVALVVIAGCAAPSSAPGAPPVDFADLLAGVISDANASGASPDQLDILERALETGEISFDDAAEANEATVACLNDAGFTAEVSIDEIQPGFFKPGYRASFPPELTFDEADRIQGQCENRENFFVSYAYQVQPAAVEAADAAFDLARPAFVACLETAGVNPEVDATKDELFQAAGDLLASSSNGGNPVDCWIESGLDG